MTARAFVVLRHGDESDTPIGTVWAADWLDASATALDLYGGPVLVLASAEHPTDFLDAFDREALATHAENEAILSYAAQRAVDDAMTVIERLFPFLTDLGY